MIKIAVLGYGTVGSGVVEVLSTNYEKITQRARQEIEGSMPGNQLLVGGAYALSPLQGLFYKLIGRVYPSHSFKGSSGKGIRRAKSRGGRRRI